MAHSNAETKKKATANEIKLFGSRFIRLKTHSFLIESQSASYILVTEFICLDGAVKAILGGA